jgi:serine/threonine-protein kinase
MAFCTQCAHEIPEGARFCPACGTPVAVEAVRAGQPAPRGATQATTIDSDSAPSTWTPHGRFEPGTRFGTRYRIVALLGKGGMGEVYRADDLELGQSVALKFLLAEKATRPGALNQFRSEVRTARLIAHPNVCRVYDIGEGDGQVFLSMEYIDGEDLATVIRRLGRPTPEKAREIARELCRGLAAAHEAGMLHRDLKPGNVMIDGRGRARITDFGLAGLAADLMREGQVAGTPTYMAPEQLAQGKVSVRSDVYSLGLVLYELFTGRRVFEATSLSELRQMQESGSITTPSDVARGIDPAVERVIMHCLEHDPDSRPTSAYAVLAALPGGDPLAAALAAGETPSPELVANSGERGVVSPRKVTLWFSLGLLCVGIWNGMAGHSFSPMTQSTQVLSVRASDLLTRTDALPRLPAHAAEGFALNQAELAGELERAPEHSSTRSPIYFWRRWSGRTITPLSIHVALPQLDDPVGIAPGDAAVMLDPVGRLIGLRAVPPDTTVAANGAVPVWSVLWTAAGLDSAKLTKTALVRPVPATCDSAAAWSTRLPWNGEAVTVQAGASHGRLVDFSIVHDWGASTSPIDSPQAPGDANNWAALVFNGTLVVASMFFGIRNLRLGRGDWRGATRIALLVFVANQLIGAFSTRLSEDGILGLLGNMLIGRTFNHALVHSFEVWFAYIALEPYVRRLWPRMLVSWTRLISGRWRDPLVGRDVLLGTTVGAVLMASAILTASAGTRFGLFRIPTILGPEALLSLTKLSNTATEIAYDASICLLATLGGLVFILAFRMLFRSTWAALVITLLIVTVANAPAAAALSGWPFAIISSITQALTLVVLFRYGVLACTVAIFVQNVLGTVVASLALSSWYADRVLVPIMLMIALFAYGAWAALAGKSILGDPLREKAR